MNTLIFNTFVNFKICTIGIAFRLILCPFNTFSILWSTELCKSECNFLVKYWVAWYVGHNHLRISGWAICDYDMQDIRSSAEVTIFLLQPSSNTLHAQQIPLTQVVLWAVQSKCFFGETSRLSVIRLLRNQFKN